MKRLAALLLGSAVVLAASVAAMGELSEQQREYVARLKEEIDQAARLFKQEEFDKSKAQVERCQRILTVLARDADGEMRSSLQPAHDRLTKAHTLFAAKGIELAPLAAFPAAGGGGAARTDARAGTAPAQGTSTTVSFTKQVAPILVTRCGGCHVGRNMGEFSMATFAALMQGSEAGEVIAAGKPDESTLFELVQSGEMPPPRPRPRPVPKSEVQLIRDWIAQGAEYDGQREDERLLDVVPAEVARAASGPGSRGAPGGFGGGRGPGGRPTRGGR
jgi:mono/diheme cytochrome c family protein